MSRWACLECGEPVRERVNPPLGSPRYEHADPVVFTSHAAVRGAGEEAQ